ncbi:MAG TPA: TetR/AcrR family transcriptional regulator [Methanobacterium sp.]|nr:TetR/AcrR family transcriptional regulator [Methanobacterium sp.]
MVDKTEQKIMEAALKVFSENGYKGATTRVIANESGFNELTLFRRFKNKENLFNRVLTQNSQKLKEEFVSSFGDAKFENSEDFLKAFIKDLKMIIEKNFELIHLLDKEPGEKSDALKEELVNFLSTYAEKNIQNEKIDYKALVISIFALVYTLILSKHHGDTFMDQDEVLEGFINNTIMCIR